MNNPTTLPQATAAFLSDAVSNATSALVGFDGFVDTICDAVDTRQSATEYQRIPTLKAFGERIAAAAGQSTNVEIVPTLVKLGGNGPIMANALASLGLGVTYCGMTGFPTVHPVFELLATRAQLLPICEPALTDAYEFDDGKLIVGKHATVAQVSFEQIIEKVGETRWCAAWNEANFVAMVNWTMLPYMTPLWKSILETMDQSSARKTLFFDLADPEKRGRADIVEAMEIIASFQPFHDVILGLNEKEAVQVAGTLDIASPVGGVLTPDTAIELADAIRARLEIGVVVIHPTRFAAGANSFEAVAVDGPYIANPKISTGAGDHFNAGFCYGQILGASLEKSLQMGVGTSGYYVRSAQSPTREELAGFLKTL